MWLVVFTLGLRTARRCPCCCFSFWKKRRLFSLTRSASLESSSSSSPFLLRMQPDIAGYVPGYGMPVTLKGQRPFKGFLIYAVNDNQAPVGTWTGFSAENQLHPFEECGFAATHTPEHTVNGGVLQDNLIWVPQPGVHPKDVTFRVSIVEVRVLNSFCLSFFFFFSPGIQSIFCCFTCDHQHLKRRGEAYEIAHNLHSFASETRTNPSIRENRSTSFGLRLSPLSPPSPAQRTFLPQMTATALGMQTLQTLIYPRRIRRLCSHPPTAACLLCCRARAGSSFMGWA